MRKGFTLIEIMLVAAAIVILMAATMPNLKGVTERLRLETAASHLAQQLRFAQQQAIVRDEDVVWTWDVERQQSQLYLITEERNESIIAPLNEQRLQGRLFAELPTEIELTRDQDGLSCTDGRLTEGCGRCVCVHFHPDGTLQDGSSKPIRMILTHDKSSYTIRVDPPTGHVALLHGAVAQ